MQVAVRHRFLELFCLIPPVVRLQYLSIQRLAAVFPLKETTRRQTLVEVAAVQACQDR